MSKELVSPVQIPKVGWLLWGTNTSLFQEKYWTGEIPPYCVSLCRDRGRCSFFVCMYACMHACIYLQHHVSAAPICLNVFLLLYVVEEQLLWFSDLFFRGKWFMCSYSFGGSVGGFECRVFLDCPLGFLSLLPWLFKNHVSILLEFILLENSLRIIEGMRFFTFLKLFTKWLNN